MNTCASWRLGRNFSLCKTPPSRITGTQAPSSIPALVGYLQEHFTTQDINSVGDHAVGTAYGHVDAFTLAPRAAFAGWPGDLLAAEADADLLAWGASRGIPSTTINGLAQLRALRTLVQTLLAEQRAVPLSVWYTKLPTKARDAGASALYLGLRTAVLFAGLRRADLEPMIGLWPAAAEDLLRPPAVRPTTVVPVERFEAAIMMEDMTAVLATVVASPIRVRANDMSVFARTQAEIGARLIPVPEWAAPMAIGPHQSRVDAAAGALDWRKWVRVQPKQHPELTSTAAGVKWLALSPRDRLATLLDPIRASKARNPRGAYEGQGDDGGFFPYSMPYYREPKGLQPLEALTTAFLELSDGFYLLEPFLDFASRSANPFFALPRDAMNELQRQVYFGGVDPRAGFRSLWRNAMSGFLFGRLVAFGGATLGHVQDGAICFAITDIGRYLLGASKQFDYGLDSATDIVVQPNFDVVFLGGAPIREATLARVAERVGVAPGLVFRITRASVMRAAESGLTTDAVLATLRDASSKPVPQNVQREIGGWMSAVRRAQLRLMQVIDCGNDETANRVVALLGAKVKRLTSTVIELPALAPAARGTIHPMLNMPMAAPLTQVLDIFPGNHDMRSRNSGVGLVMCAILAACDENATSPSYSLDLAEITIDAPSRSLGVPDSAFVGEPFRITAYGTNRGCESPGGLSVTSAANRVRIVGAVQVASGKTLACPDIGGWVQTTTATATVEGPLTIVLVGRVRDRTDSVSRVVRVVPRRALPSALASATTAPPSVSVHRNGAE